MVDSGPVAAFGAAADSSGGIWVAVARDSQTRVCRSTDYGLSWPEVASFVAGSDVTGIEVVTGGGDSSFVYVFCLERQGSGDLRVVRISEETRAVAEFEVAVGPDTVGDFSVAADRDRHHYLYCLYANEMRTGRTGNFIRSLDFAKSWEAPQPWWNCWDPFVTYAGGSAVHCAWRYAANGSEIHFQTNNYYGAPRRWWPYHLASGQGKKCWDPVVVQADTGQEWNSRVWVFYTAAWRDTLVLDIGYGYSWDGGWSWATGWGTPTCTLGSAFDDEWLADARPVLGSPVGPIHLCYNSGAGLEESTCVIWRSSNAVEPESWSGAVRFAGDPGDSRANALDEAIRPRVVCPAGSPHNWPGFLYSRRFEGRARGLYFGAPWRTGNDPRHDAERIDALRITRQALRWRQAWSGERGACVVYDRAGRAVRRISCERAGSDELRSFEWDGRDERGELVPAGIYFGRIAGADPAVPARVRFTVFR